MRILVLSNAFKVPNFNSRLRYQCEYLVQQGHTIEVYVESWSRIMFAHTYPIHEIDESKPFYLGWFLYSLYSLLTNRRERKFAYQVLWSIRKQSFDLVFCATDSFFPLGAASMIAQRLQIPLCVDITDLRELSPSDDISNGLGKKIQKWQQGIYMQRRNQALQMAHSITTVSPAHEDILRGINPNVTLIYNGFDPQSYSRKETKTNVFRIDYIGRLKRNQNINMMIKAMQPLFKELPKIQWTFHTNRVGNEFLKYRHSPKIRGLLPEELVGDILQQTSIVLMVNNETDNGIQTDILYQAIGCEKPILFTPTKDGLVPDLLRFTHVGIATDDAETFQNFIREKYHEWEQNGCVHQPVEHKELFNRLSQAQQLEQILIRATK